MGWNDNYCRLSEHFHFLGGGECLIMVGSANRIRSRYQLESRGSRKAKNCKSQSPQGVVMVRLDCRIVRIFHLLD